MISVSAGLVSHGQTGAVDSVFDWDSANPGDQTLPASAATTVLLNLGSGIDSVGFTTTASQLGHSILTGGQGNDTLAGGGGNDTFLWNTGDGSDTFTGSDGFDGALVSGDPRAIPVDTFVFQVNGAYARLSRVSGATFSLDLSVESLTLDTLSGDDQITAGSGMPALQTLTLIGGPGNDQIAGGDLPDTIVGGDGDDSIVTSGGGNDLIGCGPGTDLLTADASPFDPSAECETENRPVVPPPTPPDTTATALAIGSGKLKLKKNATKVKVSCPSEEAGGCEGTLTLTTAKKVSVSAKTKLELGSKTFDLDAGKAATLKVKLPKKLKKLVRGKSLKLKASAVSSDAAGNTATSSRKLTLSLGR